MVRGSGRTTKQLKAAPVGAYFICPGRAEKYTRDLARFISREDLRIVSVDRLNDFWFAGRRGAVMVVDHWLDEDTLTARQRETLAAAREWLVPI